MDNLIPILVAVLGAGGFGAFFREIVAGIAKVVGGMSARESKLKVDIALQRDQALIRADDEGTNRRRLQDYGARLRVRLIELGDNPELEPALIRTTEPKE